MGDDFLAIGGCLKFILTLYRYEHSCKSLRGNVSTPSECLLVASPTGLFFSSFGIPRFGGMGVVYSVALWRRSVIMTMFWLLKESVVEKVSE